MIRIGPAGWSYDDWQDIVYPRGRPERRLERVASLFTVIEINSSFYRPPTPHSAERWVQAVRARAGFRFTAKLYRAFTHDDPQSWTLADRDNVQSGLKPLVEAELLGAVLAQFPWFFAASDEALHRLARIRKAFPDYPLVVELRHRTWLEPAMLERISALGYSFCNMDMPQSGTSIALGHVVTGPTGYLRLHGRNARKWFDPKAEVHEKYDYLYDERQLERIVEEAQAIRGRTEDLYIIANNHFEGKGPANALELQAAFGGELPALPETMVARYPRLTNLRTNPGAGPNERVR